MKRSILGLAGVLIIGAGCSTNMSTAMRDTVGPCAGPPATQSGAGYLVVFSSWDHSVALDYDYAARAPYNVYEDNGLLRHVDNNTGGYDRNPVRLALNAGRYDVESFVPGDGLIHVPVVIQPGETTTLFLDGSGNRLKKSPRAESLVYLPDGDVAGCDGEMSGAVATQHTSEGTVGMAH